MKLAFPSTLPPLSDPMLSEAGTVKNTPIETAVAKSPSLLQRASVAKGNSLRNTLLSKYAGRAGAKREETGGSSWSLQLQDIATEALASNHDAVRELASTMLQRDATIGPNGLTLRGEQVAFKGFARPGFATLETSNEAVQRLLDKVFGSIDALATAATRRRAPLHHAARMAVERGHVPGNTPVGLSTMADEMRHFSGMQRVGF